MMMIIINITCNNQTKQARDDDDHFNIICNNQVKQARDNDDHYQPIQTSKR